jgi:hypothetical protein
MQLKSEMRRTSAKGKSPFCGTDSVSFGSLGVASFLGDAASFDLHKNVKSSVLNSFIIFLLFLLKKKLLILSVFPPWKLVGDHVHPVPCPKLEHAPVIHVRV